MNSTASRFATLMGSASLLTLTAALSANAQQTAQAQMAQTAPGEAPEQVLVTGSLIHGAVAIGVPVTNLGVQDFTETGNVFIGDLFRTIPQANVAPGPSAVNSGGHQERETRVNIRGLDGTGPRSLLMVDGVRFPPQADGLCAIDPSVIPALALDRVDILADGASATYGSDAIAGVINVVLKRGFPATHYFAQTRVVFAVARSRCNELFSPPACMTLWNLPAELEDQFEEHWHSWLDQGADWTPFFEQLAALDGADLLKELVAFGLISPSEVEAVGKLRRSAENRAVALTGTHQPSDDVITLLAAGFFRGEPGNPAIPYARLEG